MNEGSPSDPTSHPPPTPMPGRPHAKQETVHVSSSAHGSAEKDAALAPQQRAQTADEEGQQLKRKVADWQHHSAQDSCLHPNGVPDHNLGPPATANGASASASNGVATQSSSLGTSTADSPTATATPTATPTATATAPDLRLSDQSRRLAALRVSGSRSVGQEALATALAECERALAAAHVREAELQRETRVLAARLAYLRMAHEAQAGKLAEAAVRAVGARAEVVAENAALAGALAQAQHQHASIAQQLLPMLALHGLTPPPSDPPALCSAVTALVDRLATEVNLLQKVVAGGGPVLEQRLAAVLQDAATWPTPMATSVSLPAPPAAPLDGRGSPDSSLSLATGMGPTPSPLFPNGAWSPLPPGAALSPRSRSRSPPSPSPSLPAAPPPQPPTQQEAPSAQWVLGGSSTGLERPTSVRFRPTPDTAADGHEAVVGAMDAGMRLGSMTRRSPMWRMGQETSGISAVEGRGGSSLLRDSQRNLLDSVASQSTRGLAASQDPSTWQMSSLAEAPPVDAPLTDAAPSGDQDDDDDDNKNNTNNNEPLPGIVNLTVAGEACLGGKLTACGHSVFGSSLCYFQWVRHNPDNSAYLIEGAKQPEYLVSADDACCQITVECLPVDSRGRKGELVKAAANNGDPIPLDEVTANLLTGYAASGKARFRVLDAHNAMEHELVIDRRSFTIKRGSHVVIKEPYGIEVAAEIAVNEASIVLIHISGGRRMDLDCVDNRSRDLAVLTLRHFVETHAQYLEDRTRRRSFFSRR